MCCCPVGGATVVFGHCHCTLSGTSVVLPADYLHYYATGQTINSSDPLYRVERSFLLSLSEISSSFRYVQGVSTLIRLRVT